MKLSTFVLLLFSALCSTTFIFQQTPHYNPTKDKDTYYDESLDKTEIDNYYSSIINDRFINYGNLSRLSKINHKHVYSYNEARHSYLYPTVDRQENGKIIGIYTRITFDENKNNNLPYNCEHTVPQSWFKKQKPMVSDMHHMFSAEPRCNSYRSNYPHGDFSVSKVNRTLKNSKKGCGQEFGQHGSCPSSRRSYNNNNRFYQSSRNYENDFNDYSVTSFEPFSDEAKGPIARAILYFIVRYPGIIHCSLFPLKNIEEIKNWAKRNPPTVWEKHRNFYIGKFQGNRNPFIDHLEWVDKIDFKKGMGF